jgi:hypothetical protein
MPAAPAPSPYQGRSAAPMNALVGRMAAPPAGVPAGFGAAQRTSNSLGVGASAPQQPVGNILARKAGVPAPQAPDPNQARAASYGASMGQPGGQGNQFGAPQRAAGSGTPQDAAQAQAKANAGMKTVGGFNFY